MINNKIQTIKEVTALIFIYICAWILFELISVDNNEPGASLLIEETVDILIVILLLNVVKKNYSTTLEEIGIVFTWSFKNTFLGIILGIIFWVVAGLASDALNLFLPSWVLIPPEDNYILYYEKTTSVEKGLMFLVLGLTTPLIEEVFFRGLIYSILSRAFTVPSSIIISSSLFGLVHVYLDVMLISFLFGCLLAWFREHRKSLVGPIIAHASLNCLSLVFA